MSHLIFFDATCPLCIQSVLKVIQWDRHRVFLFSPLKQKLAEEILSKEAASYDSVILLENYNTSRQRLWKRGRAFFRIFWLLKGKWRLLGWLCFFPFGVDFFYRMVALRRHSIIEKSTQFKIPAQEKDRFL